MTMVCDRCGETFEYPEFSISERTQRVENNSICRCITKKNRKIFIYARNGRKKRMSYDISLCDPVTHETLKADSVHFIAGGVRIVGGTEKLMCYVTWNYRKFYRRNDVLGKKGIRSIYGKTGAESIPMLEKAIAALGDDTDDDDYWHATEGNAKRALYWLLEFAKMRPDGVWDGD